jgi:hypothetical protein
MGSSPSKERSNNPLPFALFKKSDRWINKLSIRRDGITCLVRGPALAPAVGRGCHAGLAQAHFRSE